jgi:hypothetical protein
VVFFSRIQGPRIPKEDKEVLAREERYKERFFCRITC